MKTWVSCLITALLLLWAGAAHAAIEPYQQQLSGKLKKGDTLLVKDEKFENPAYDWQTIRNYGVLDRITFTVNPDTLVTFSKNFSCKIDLKIEYWSSPGQDNPITLPHIPLTIRYDTAAGAVYQLSDQYDFKNAYKIKITVNDISSAELGELPPVFLLKAQVVVNRDYLPQKEHTLEPVVSMVPAGTASRTTTTAFAAANANAGAGQVQISWDANGAQKFDLEWTFVDEESTIGRSLEQNPNQPEATLAIIFRNNSSRVTVMENSYRIPVTQQYKFLLVRIRTVDESDQFRTEGPWVYTCKLDGVQQPGVIALDAAWHRPALNWQYSVSFAEDGKRKEVMSYLDGTLRNRQTVTLNNSDQVAVAAESVLDQFGRPVASILPAPLAANKIDYYPLLNKNTSGGAYTAANIFKGLTGNCIGKPDPLNTSSGAAYYYSPANQTLGGDFRKYIPDAEGYPLAITSYTPDNTGRISQQGGVGPALQPDPIPANSHATRYYYGKPEQWELDRLFGNDAGYANHYLKNMVVDPNGEVSISYQNAAGKTVATALTGTNPNTSLLPLASRPAAVRSTVTLLQPGRFVFDPQLLKLTASTTYLASVPNVTDNLKFSMPSLIKRYQQNGVSICSNCYYELKVVVADDCNNKLVEMTNMKTGKELSDCSATADYTNTIAVPVNKVGEYYITFELALNPKVIAAYTEDFIARNTNLKTHFQFVMEALAKEDFSGCFAECTTCKTALGQKTDFVNALRDRLQRNGVDVTTNAAVVNTWAQGLYDALYANCQTLRANCMTSPCDRLERALKADVTPGGQFALFAEDGTPKDSAVNVVFNYWRTVFPVQAQGSADYEREKIELEDGSYISPHDAGFGWTSVKRYWKPEWAAKFIIYHPEYCALTYCRNNSSYIGWDQRLREIHTSAADIPVVAPGKQYSYTNGDWLVDADPFFKGPGSSKVDAFRADLNNYSRNILGVTDNRLNNKHLSAYVDYQLYCADSLGATNVNGTGYGDHRWNNCTPAASCRVPDREWQQYVEYYLQVKEKYSQQFRNEGPCKGQCVVGGYPGVSKGSTASVADLCAQFDVGMFSYYEFTPPDDIHPLCYLEKVSGPPIPKGITLIVNLFDPGGTPTLVDTELFTYNSPTRKIVILPSNPYRTLELSCTGYVVDPDSACPATFKGKISHVNNLAFKAAASVNLDSSLNAGKDSIRVHLSRSCAANVQSLLTALSTRFTDMRADSQALFRARLEEVCRNGGDSVHVNGSSSVRPGRVNADGDATFEQVMRRYLGSFSLDANPWMQDALYPYETPVQSVARAISNTNEGICARLNAYIAEKNSTQPAATLYNFLVGKFGVNMTLTEPELNALVKGCTNCRHLLDREMKLPVFLDGNAGGWISAATFNAAHAAFNTTFGGAPNTSHVNYEDVYRNFMNQRFGFTLSYLEYQTYRQKLESAPQEILCNNPVYDVVPVDPYQCMLELTDGAVIGASRLYGTYVDSVRRAFRNEYVLLCGGVQPKVTLETSQQHYHYTLYYYDQAGSLVRTVPPEGVDIITDQQVLDRIDQARRVDYSSCSYNGPVANTNPQAALDMLSASVTNTANRSVEFWLHSDNGSASQVITPAGSNKIYFYLCQSDKYLNVSIYNLAYPSQTNVDILSSKHVTVDLSTILPLGQFTHVVVQGANLSDPSAALNIFVNGRAFAPLADPLPTACEWTIGIGSNGNATFTTDLTHLKQLRVYTRQLSGTEITANAQEVCMGMAPAYSTALLRDTMIWARLNTPQPGSPTTVPGQGTTEGQILAVYPRHRLTTDYAYNSLGQVVQQRSPDAGMSYFWYDYKGRLVASRNAVQVEKPNQYSYTVYDFLGRITEVGERLNARNLGVPDFISQSILNDFDLSGTKSQITNTYYDMPLLSATYGQANLRKRVSASLYRDTPQSAAVGSYYSYDAIGNVKTLWQQLYSLYEMKQTDYNYDLVSGKVNAVRYQFGKPDQFFYNYEYDAENRLIGAYSNVTHAGDGWKIFSSNGANRNANYRYYLHGPLARTEIGKEVQGIDYAYTLQGWLKGINGTGLTPAQDIGQDGATGGRSTFAPDVMGYSLDYFTGDYKPIDNSVNALAMKYAPSASDITGHNLFNGNISRTTLALSKLNNGVPVGYSYRYDQLNRLVRMRQHQAPAGTTTWGFAQSVEDFKEDISYDGNGNILSYLRNGTRDTSVSMDNLTYYYPLNSDGKLVSNQLRHVKDAVADPVYKSDIDNMSDDNYLYDNIGNLVKDRAAGIRVSWNLYGKISSILFDDNSSLVYKYDASGNRTYKSFQKNGAITRTWYSRDAQGNALAVYSDNGGSQIYWKEQQLYGSSRLGMWMPEMVVSGGTIGNAITLWGQTNLMRYELSNHLGNVMATISDTKTGSAATVYSAVDYAPFGMQMVGRKWSLSGGYRYGFNGKENDNEVKGEGNQQDYGMRIYDPRVGKFLSVDPLSPKYPMLTPYQFASNRPIDGVDIDGKEWGQETIIGYDFDAGLTLMTSNILRIKIVNDSKLITSPDIIKAKAELFAKSIEDKFTNFHPPMLMPSELTKTAVVLDFTPPDPNDGNIAYLYFDDRKTTVKQKTIGNTIFTTTSVDAGVTRGEINGFEMRIGITIDGKPVPDKDLILTFQHEVGHSGGLSHPWSLSKEEAQYMPELDQNGVSPSRELIKTNLMNSGENPNGNLRDNNGTVLTNDQLNTINRNVNKKSLWSAEELKKIPANNTNSKSQ
ncbi:RHS repeat domain-containing protein [Chitinophaga eiseniae]|nr:RHS repeat-associated core domain-containing protein [Chitinophaga eiseniae]